MVLLVHRPDVLTTHPVAHVQRLGTGHYEDANAEWRKSLLIRRDYGIQQVLYGCVVSHHSRSHVLDFGLHLSDLLLDEGQLVLDRLQSLIVDLFLLSELQFGV